MAESERLSNCEKSTGWPSFCGGSEGQILAGGFGVGVLLVERGAGVAGHGAEVAQRASGRRRRSMRWM